MISDVRARSTVVFAVLGSALVAAQVVAATTLARAAEPSLVAVAMSVDLAVGLPLLGWFTLVRRGAAPAVVAPLFLLGVALLCHQVRRVAFAVADRPAFLADLLPRLP